MKKSIKSNVRKINHMLEKQFDEVWNVIAQLDFDPVSGNSPHINSQLSRDLNELRQLVEEAKGLADKIADYQSCDRITYNPRPKHRRVLREPS